MNIREEDITRARNGDDHALSEVLTAYLGHIQAVADLLTVASSDEHTPDELNNWTVRNAAWLMEAEASKAMDILSVWADSKQKGVAA